MSMDAPGYEQLAAVLQAAYDQAAAGKGAERHADGKPFHEQPMQTGSDMLGTDAGLAFQAIKKIREGSTFVEFDRFERELLGAINYIAGMVIWRRRQLPRMTEAHPSAEQSLGRMKRASSIDGVRQEGETIIVSTPEQRAAIYAALGAVPNADGGTVSIHFGAQPFCAECEYPDDGTGTHYATCSKLTAPKEFVEQVEATFDELEADPGRYCPECHVPAGYLHLPERPRMRQLKQRTDKLLDDAVADQRGIGAALQDSVDNARAALEAMKNPPVEDPWAGAPKWAKYKAQDADGKWYFHSDTPKPRTVHWAAVAGQKRHAGDGVPTPNWRDTLSERP